MPQQSAAGCLKGVTVLCTGFPDHTRQELHKLVVDLGGTSTPNYSANSPPNVLIAQSVLSPKYKAVVAAQPDITIVDAGWLRACKHAGKKVPFDRHILATFAGLEICISGYPKRKVQMGALINQYGGHYNAELNKATCHVLVSELPSGQKYKVGKTWGKEIVTDKWLQASIDARHCKDIAAYSLDEPQKVDLPQSRVPPGPAPVLATGPQAAKPQTPALPAAQLASAQPQGASLAKSSQQQRQQQPQQQKQSSQQQKEQQLKQQQHKEQQHKEQQQQAQGAGAQQQRVASKPQPSAKQNQTVAKAAANVEEALPAGQNGKASAWKVKLDEAFLDAAPEDSAELSRPARRDDQDCLFLSGVRLHLCCCTPQEQLQLVRIAREGCALRHTDLSPGLTHIVLGSDPTAAEVQAVKEYVQQHRSEVRVVQAHWLRSCGDQRTLLTAANGYSVPLDTLTAPMQRSSPDKRGQQGRAEGGGGHESENGGATAGQGHAGGDEEPFDLYAVRDSLAPKHQALKGFWFTLAALEHSDKAEAQRAVALVRRHGGRRFTAQTLHLLQEVDKANILALCPCSLPKQTVAQLQAWGDFTSVPEKQRVSMLWLEWVTESGRIIPWQQRGSVACRPFPFSLPLPGMSSIRVTVSSYPEDIKTSIAHLVSIMGGRYTTSLGKKNSHLLIRAAAGPKFAGCATRGVRPVTADWLIESAHAGRLLDERDFQPPALAEGESEAGFSQMPFDTQMGTQGGTQANLLTRFGAVDAPKRATAGGSQANGRPMSLLQKVAQDAKRRTLNSSQGGLGLARELSQAHSITSAGAMPPPKPQAAMHAPSGQTSQDTSLLDAMLQGEEERVPGHVTGPTTFDGIAKSLRLAHDSSSKLGDPDPSPEIRHPLGVKGGGQGAEKQPDRALESALSRLGGMLESAGPSTNFLCSQSDAPAEIPLRTCGTAGWPATATSSGNGTFPAGRASRPNLSGNADSQGTSQGSLPRAKRKAREGAMPAPKGKRPSVEADDALLSQLGCSQQVGYEGANTSTGIGPLSRLRGATDIAFKDPSADCPSAKAIGQLAKAEAHARQKLAGAAMPKQLSIADRDDLEEMGLM